MNPALVKLVKKFPKSRYYYLQIRKWLGFEKHLGMTTYAEQLFYREYAEKTYKGMGELVDLGSWLGSTTLALLKGLEKNPAFVNGQHKLYCYDLFIWDSWMNNSVKGTELEGKYKDGDSFEGEFRKRITAYTGKTQVYAADLTNAIWGEEKQIEFLLIDAMKSPDLVSGIFSGFFHGLIPGNSHVLQQDFCHYFTPWVHVFHYRLRDFLIYVTDVKESGSVLFFYQKEVPSEMYQTRFELDTVSDEEASAIFAYSIGLVSEDNKPAIAAAHSLFWYHKGNKEKAEKTFHDYLSKGTKRNLDMQKAQGLIAAMNK